VDDVSFEDEMPADELAAVQRALAELGEAPLPPGVTTRLEARLAAELTSSPLSARRARRRRVRLGASLSAAAAIAAAIVFALSSGGGHPVRDQASALRTSAASATADSAAKTAAGTIEAADAQAQAPLRSQAKKCPPASRTGDGRRPGACPGARGGHARAV
jgi:hypothetical protein